MITKNALNPPITPDDDATKAASLVARGKKIRKTASTRKGGSSVFVAVPNDRLMRDIFRDVKELGSFTLFGYTKEGLGSFDLDIEISDLVLWGKKGLYLAELKEEDTVFYSVGDGYYFSFKMTGFQETDFEVWSERNYRTEYAGYSGNIAQILVKVKKEERSRVYGEPVAAPRMSLKSILAGKEAAKYTMCHLKYEPLHSQDFLERSKKREVKEKIRQVIEVEAPITEWLLIDRVLNSYDVRKAGSNIRPMMQSILKEMNLNTTDENGNKVYWKSSQDPDQYKEFRVPSDIENRRSIDNIPFIEVVNAVRFEETKFGRQRKTEDVIKDTAELFGFSRIGKTIREVLEEAIKHYRKHKK